MTCTPLTSARCMTTGNPSRMMRARRASASSSTR
ncbi:Uncharacterised protein [Bordetella pertussis]|nr:Uncharacterised protein [Bordetella pertussis]